MKSRHRRPSKDFAWRTAKCGVPDLTFATIDHNVPTTSDERFHIKDQIAAQQIATLRKNCEAAGIPLFDIGSGRQGIVHVIGPELGLTQPGMTIVCGDSHTSTHGAFGALAFGIGTSEVEHVLATQCVSQTKPRSMRISVSGKLPEGTTSKDLILDIIRRLGTDGGTGHVIEYAGEAVRNLTMEERMTMCNMSIECGARAGMVAPDETTFAYMQGRPYAPKGKCVDNAVELLASTYHRRGRNVRPRNLHRWREAGTDRDVGHESGNVGAGDC